MSKKTHTPPAMNIRLLPGDVFCSANPMWLGSAINAIQRFWDVDNRSTYGHAGLIIDPAGTTLEALWTVKQQNVWTAYDDASKSGLLIGRCQNMTAERFIKGMAVIRPFEGRRYPFHRLLLHLLPPLSKYISTGRYLVCSELVALFLVGSGQLDFYKGVNPDYVAGMIYRWDDWDVIYEKEVTTNGEEKS